VRPNELSDIVVESTSAIDHALDVVTREARENEQVKDVHAELVARAATVLMSG
jgi:hypothetical protein